MQKEQNEPAVRLDQWLHAARFYKTRALSAQAVKAGRILLNGSKVKPAHVVKCTDQLQIKRGDEIQQVIVLQVSKRRGSATIAATLYEETADSILARAAQRDKRQLQSDQAPHPARRPDKKSRRQIMEFMRPKK